MKKSVYIIGNYPPFIDSDTQLNYYKVQMMFTELGYNAINPLERLCSKEYTKSDAKRKNLKDLMIADAVYIMPDVELSKNNLEIKLAIDLNIHTIISFFDSSSTFPKKQKRKRIDHKSS